MRQLQHRVKGHGVRVVHHRKLQLQRGLQPRRRRLQDHLGGRHAKVFLDGAATGRGLGVQRVASAGHGGGVHDVGGRGHDERRSAGLRGRRLRRRRYRRAVRPVGRGHQRQFVLHRWRHHRVRRGPVVRVVVQVRRNGLRQQVRAGRLRGGREWRHERRRRRRAQPQRVGGQQLGQLSRRRQRPVRGRARRTPIRRRAVRPDRRPQVAADAAQGFLPVPADHQLDAGLGLGLRDAAAAHELRHRRPVPVQPVAGQLRLRHRHRGRPLGRPSVVRPAVQRGQVLRRPSPSPSPSPVRAGQQQQLPGRAQERRRVLPPHLPGGRRRRVRSSAAAARPTTASTTAAAAAQAVRLAAGTVQTAAPVRRRLCRVPAPRPRGQPPRVRGRQTGPRPSTPVPQVLRPRPAVVPGQRALVPQHAERGGRGRVAAPSPAVVVVRFVFVAVPPAVSPPPSSPSPTATATAAAFAPVTAALEIRVQSKPVVPGHRGRGRRLRGATPSPPPSPVTAVTAAAARPDVLARRLAGGHRVGAGRAPESSAVPQTTSTAAAARDGTPETRGRRPPSPYGDRRGRFHHHQHRRRGLHHTDIVVHDGVGHRIVAGKESQLGPAAHIGTVQRPDAAQTDQRPGHRKQGHSNGGYRVHFARRRRGRCVGFVPTAAAFAFVPVVAVSAFVPVFAAAAFVPVVDGAAFVFRTADTVVAG